MNPKKKREKYEEERLGKEFWLERILMRDKVQRILQ